MRVTLTLCPQVNTSKLSEQEEQLEQRYWRGAPIIPSVWPRLRPLTACLEDKSLRERADTRYALNIQIPSTANNMYI